MNAVLEIVDDRLTKVINIDFTIEVLDTTCGFSEGPVWNKKGYYLFSDIPNNIISKIEPGKRKEVFLERSGCAALTPDIDPPNQGSNGLGYSSDGSLIICQHGNHAIAKFNADKLETLVGSYNNKPLNSPNDIIIAKDGRVFFSDPPYGLAGQKIMADKFQPVAGVYVWNNKTLELICDAYQYPNGLCLSPDETKLYICSNKPFERFVTEYNTSDFSKHRVLCNENGDGFECDRKGNLYLCAKEGVVIVDSDGKRLGVIHLETIAANACWGGAEGNDFFITARQNIYMIKNLQRA